MALLWIEGFDSFGTSTGAAPSPTGIVARKYATIGAESSMRVVTGRYGRALRLDNNAQYMSPANLTTDTTVIIGVAVKLATNPAGSYMNIGLYDGTGALGMNLHFTNAGEIDIYRGTTLITTTTGGVMTTGVWHYIEFKVYCHDTAGTYELKVDGVTKLSASSVDTKASTGTYHSTFRLQGSAGTGPNQDFDDLYFLDGVDSGITGNPLNDFLGNRKVTMVQADAVGDANAWTGSGGSDHYTYVNEALCDDDTSYVEDTVTGHQELWGYANVNAVTINGIQINTMCKLTDANSYTLKTLVKSGANANADTAQSVAASYASVRRLLGADPTTSNAWVVNDFNATQFGIEVG